MQEKLKKKCLTFLKYRQNRGSFVSWIMCDDRLPPIGEDVLFHINDYISVGYIDDNGEWHGFGNYHVDRIFKDKVTMWHPMPELMEE